MKVGFWEPKYEEKQEREIVMIFLFFFELIDLWIVLSILLQINSGYKRNNLILFFWEEGEEGDENYLRQKRFRVVMRHCTSFLEKWDGIPNKIYNVENVKPLKEAFLA